LESSSEFVQIGEPGGNADDFAAVLLDIVELLEELLEHLADGNEVATRSALRDIEDETLGSLDRFVRFDSFVEAEANDFRSSADQSAQSRCALDDPSIVFNVDGARHHAEELSEVGDAAGIVEASGPFEFVDNRHEVGGYPPVVKVEQSLVDDTMAPAKEIVRSEEGSNPNDGVAIDEQATEHGLLGLDIVRW